MSELFEKDALLDGIDGDIEFLGETIEMLDEDSAELLEQAQDAVTAGDSEALVGPAHALKGMLGNFCAPPAEAAAYRVERMGREGQMDEAQAAVEALREEVQRLRDALHAFLDEQQP